MDDQLDHMLMGRALAEAREALVESCLPVGAVLAAGGRVIAAGHKAMGSDHLDHAEMVVFRSVFGGDHGLTRQDDLCLYTTLEPCIMCWGALRHLPVTRLVYAMEDPYGGCTHISDLVLPPRHRNRPLSIRRGFRREEARGLFKQFLDTTREPYWMNGGAPEFTRAVRSSQTEG